jgi:2-polyprenyl-6-methoxyphenol hydroxylase-like FAD-dependent oxidoreductase
MPWTVSPTTFAWYSAAFAVSHIHDRDGVDRSRRARRATSVTVLALVVGGSLTGLAAAVALARRGIDVRVLERLQAYTGGAGLGVDVNLLQAITGTSAGDLPVIRGNRLSTSWSAVHAWLGRTAGQYSNVSISLGLEAREVRATGERLAVDTTGGEMAADLVLGADGYRSTVRRFIDPAYPDADFAGYMLWRGLCDERSLPSTLPRPDGYVAVEYAGPYRLVAYAVPGSDGSVVPGRRQISWAWYDPDRRDLLERTGCIVGERVVRTLPPEDFSAGLRQELEALANMWPTPWREAILQTLRTGEPFGTPIAEYVPQRMARGRAAIAGDAAHVASPMTGSGLRYAFLDVIALGRALDASASVEAGLREFESQRLEEDRALVLSGRAWGRSYVASAHANR